MSLTWDWLHFPPLKPEFHFLRFSLSVYKTLSHALVGRGSAVGIATRYELDGPKIESGWGRIFPHPSRPALGLTQPSVQLVRSRFLGVKAAEAWCCPPTPSSAEFKERV